MSSGFYDAHNHLQDEWLAPHRETIVRDLAALGIAGAVVNGTTEADWDAVAVLAEAHPWVYPSFGLHPWYLDQRTPHWRERLETLLARFPHAGVGEIGLDRWLRDDNFAEQQTLFTEQLALAAVQNRPASIHCLQAWGKLDALLRAHTLPERGFLLHAYGGPAAMIDGFVRRGAYFSFNGYFLHERKAERREAFRRIPLNRLLVETDAPAMPAPLEHRPWLLPDAPDSRDGKPVNHPANLEATTRALAELRGIPLDELKAQLGENFRRLFGTH